MRYKEKSKAYWEKKLPKDVYNICFLKGTEPPGSGKYNKHYEKGIYTCAVCGQKLFSSRSKFKSHTGWPSFFQPFDEAKIEYQNDVSLGVKRIEVLCSRCGSHLGHVFNDGPKPSGKRYCINSLALDFMKDRDTEY